MSKTGLFPTIQFSIQNSFISNNSVSDNYTLSVSKTVLFQTIQFSISTQFSSFDHWIGPYQVLQLQDRVDRGAMAMKGYSVIPQSISITGISPSDCLVSYLGYSLRKSFPFADKQSLYSIAAADCSKFN